MLIPCRHQAAKSRILAIVLEYGWRQTARMNEQPLLRLIAARPRLTFPHSTGSKNVRSHVLRDTLFCHRLVSGKQIYHSHKRRKSFSCRLSSFLRGQQGFLEVRINYIKQLTDSMVTRESCSVKKEKKYPSARFRRLSIHALSNTLTYFLTPAYHTHNSR